MTSKGFDLGISIFVVVLAAGRSSRMVEGRGHKLLALFSGQSLVRRSVSACRRLPRVDIEMSRVSRRTWPPKNRSLGKTNAKRIVPR
ncbi:NTP transferase domain-containing protein [Rhizobium sp. 16-449-1b]|uniref:NTP transferase domain-containing protein n=1 Tax=Rhizobium sp. 16-449-1b TaxID=2819989 RepID=UPI0024686DA6|nr:NTP transferase domain-containing protein [Rhizobium sp. 16-449-1b]